MFTKLAINTSTWEKIFKNWGTDITGFFKSIASNFVIPVIIAILLVLIIVQFARLAKLNHEGHGNELGGKIGALILTIVVTILVGTFNAWGGILF